MAQKLTRGLLTGLLGLCFLLVGCSGDSDRIVSPAGTSDETISVFQFEDNTTLDDWYDYQYDAGGETGEIATGDVGDAGADGGLNDSNSEGDEVVLDY